MNSCSNPALSLVIPCYNEEKNIPLILAALQKTFAARAAEVEVILVNNGSTDNSAAVLAAELARAQAPYLKTTLVPKNLGYGYGILQGLEVATGNVLAWTHADMQTDPHDVLKAYDLFCSQKGEKVFIKGRRLNRALLETLFTFGMQLLASIALKTRLEDINAQPKVFSRDFYATYMRLQAPHDFSLDLFALYQARNNGFKVLDFPVTFAPRLHGEAKGGGGSWKMRWKLIKRTWAYIFELRGKVMQTVKSTKIV